MHQAGEPANDHSRAESARMRHMFAIALADFVEMLGEGIVRHCRSVLQSGAIIPQLGHNA